MSKAADKTARKQASFPISFQSSFVPAILTFLRHVHNVSNP